MIFQKKVFLLLSVICLTPMAQSFESPLIVGHRGACGYRPEHTLESYELAISMGADYIEPDLVISKDGVLIARHENEISETTDVAEKFPSRKTTKKIDGKEITGWFTEDFTIKELKSLKAKERLPFRSQDYNGKFEIPTFSEVLELVAKQKRKVGIYPETKHPSYFAGIGLSLEEPLIKELEKHKMNNHNSPVFIQSFELTNLKKLSKLTKLPLIYLIDDPEIVPYDHVINGDKRTYQDMLSSESLKEIRTVAYGIGPYKRYIIPEKNGIALPATDLINRAHAIGLKVHPYTFRSDSKYLLQSYQNDPIKEYQQFFELGVDGLFTDFPDHAISAKKSFLKNKKTKGNK